MTTPIFIFCRYDILLLDMLLLFNNLFILFHILSAHQIKISGNKNVNNSILQKLPYSEMEPHKTESDMKLSNCYQ